MRTKIKDIVDNQIGYQFRGKVEHTSNGTHRVIQIKDFDDEYRLNVSTLFQITPERDIERYIVKKGDVLFLSRGQRNFAYAIMSELEKTIAAGHFFILKIKSNNILPDYLAWYINQVPAQKYLKNMARRGSHMPIVGKSDFGQMKIDIPELRTQEPIIKLSQLQEKESLLLDKIKEKRSGLLQRICLKAVGHDKTLI